MKMLRPVLGLTAVSLAALIIGCGRTNSPAPSTALARPHAGPTNSGEAWTETGAFAAGKKVMAANGCGKCHTVNGVRPGAVGPPMAGGPGPGGFRKKGAPDLGKVGEDPTHTTAWLEQYVSNPKSVRDDARMPAFAKKISQPELHSLAEYLASLK